MKRFVAKLRDGVRHDPILRSFHLAVVAVMVTAYALLLHGGLPGWSISLLHTLVWLHVLHTWLGFFGIVMVFATLERLLAKADGETRHALERFAFLPQPLTALFEAYVVLAAYIGGYPVAGAFLLGAALAKKLLRASMRAMIDRFVMERLSTL